MTGKRIGLGAVGLGIAVLVVAAFASRRLILEEWHLSRLQSTDEGTRKKAAEALAEYGSERSLLSLMEANSESAVRLLKAKGNTDALITTEGAIANLLDQQKALARQVWRTSAETQETWSRSQRKSWRTNMMNHIGALDSRARTLTTQVTGMLAIAPFFHALIKISQRAKKESILRLTRALRSDDWHVRWQAAQLLGASGPDAKDSVPVLEVKSEEDPNAFVRYAAGEAIKSIGHE